MGLDMYLTTREYVGGWSFSKDDKFDQMVALFGAPTEDSPSFYVEKTVCYWRKVNSVHKWFCNLDGGRDECQKIYVTPDNLRSLRDRCLTVLEDHDRAEELLPTGAGFFFGSTEYDEWYFKDLEDTVQQLNKVLTDTALASYLEFQYQASW